MKKNNNKGFTLVELIVVLVILAILAAILVPALLGYIEKAREKQIINNAEAAYVAAQGLCAEAYGKSLARGNYDNGTAAGAAIDFNAINTLADITVDPNTTYSFTIDDWAGGANSGKDAYKITQCTYSETKNGTTKTATWKLGEWTLSK